METILYLGIDPGASGGIAAIDGDGFAECWPMEPTEADINNTMAELAASARFAVIEAVHAFPGQGVTSTFSFGRSYGFLRGLLIAHRIPFAEVSPRAWQGALGVQPKEKTESHTQFKNRLRGRAQQLFPRIKVTLKTADALLLAEYCRRLRGVLPTA